ncbi:hypothetical protein L596_012723 [Steinernema carpocapsae]|uniref:Uncharacterized protein n=1 Tax=Steinernema carpocapsae TaxID=34508 RepID=A0A4U5NYR5_STECR|nr:hypothetical protein L596_012723 [Steinernema carpocapsae]
MSFADQPPAVPTNSVFQAVPTAQPFGQIRPAFVFRGACMLPNLPLNEKAKTHVTVANPGRICSVYQTPPSVQQSNSPELDRSTSPEVRINAADNTKVSFETLGKPRSFIKIQPTMSEQQRFMHLLRSAVATHGPFEDLPVRAASRSDLLNVASATHSYTNTNSSPSSTRSYSASCSHEPFNEQFDTESVRVSPASTPEPEEDLKQQKAPDLMQVLDSMRQMQSPNLSAVASILLRLLSSEEKHNVEDGQKKFEQLLQHVDWFLQQPWTPETAVVRGLLAIVKKVDKKKLANGNDGDQEEPTTSGSCCQISRKKSHEQG